MRKSFTLIELLVVVAIISVLLGLMLPAIGEVKRQGGKTVCGSNLRQLGLAFSMYRSDYSDTFPCATDPVNSEKNWWLWMGRGIRSFLEPYIAPKLSAQNPQTLFCPQDKSPIDKYENTSYGYTMSFYHSPDQINAMTSTAHLYDKTLLVPSVPIQSHRVAYPDKKILCGEWFSNHRPVTMDYLSAGWWCWQGARMFLFADNHVDFIPVEKIKTANDSYPDANLTKNGIEGRDI